MGFKGWKQVKLEDIIDINPPRLPLEKNKKARKVSMANIAEFTRKISGYVYADYKGGSKFQNGDTLMARITPCLENGKTAYVSILADDEVAFGSTEFFVLRAKEDRANSKYIYYLSISDEIRNVVIQSMTGTSGRQRAQKEALLNYELRVPPIKEQIKIGNTLSNIDENMELNKNIISNLEELAQTLFKRWFVDFEFPNENGKPYRSGGGKMVESELGMIPEGWVVNTISELVDVIDNRGKTPTLEKEDTTYPIIDVKGLSGNDRVVNFNNCLKHVSKETYNSWFRNGHPDELDILFSTVGSIGSIKLFYGDKGCIAQNVVALRSKKVSPFYLYQYIKDEQEEIKSYNIGSVQPSIKITHFIKKRIFKPGAKIENEFHLKIKSISNKVYSLNEENKKLEELRDTLLPKLLSGELELPSDGEVTDDVPVS